MITDLNEIQKIKNSGSIIVSVTLEEFQKMEKTFLSTENYSLVQNNFGIFKKNIKLKTEQPQQINVPTKIEIKLVQET